MRIFLAILLTAATLAGCAGTSFGWEQARAVRVGMTTQEVEAVLGKPYMVQSRGDGTQSWVWSHGNGITGAARAVSFPVRDGRVIGTPDIPFS